MSDVREIVQEELQKQRLREASEQRMCEEEKRRELLDSLFSMSNTTDWK